MIDLRNTNINHKIWGVGTVVEQTEKSIIINFSVGDKQFQYPEAFEKFLTCSNNLIQDEVLIELKNKKQREYDNKINAQKERGKASAVHNIPSKKAIGKKIMPKKTLHSNVIFVMADVKTTVSDIQQLVLTN